MTKTKYNVVFQTIGLDNKYEIVLKAFLDIEEAFKYLGKCVEPYENHKDDDSATNGIWVVNPNRYDPDDPDMLPDRYDICLIKETPSSEVYQIYVGAYMLVEEMWEVDTMENPVEEPSDLNTRKEKYRAKLYEAVDIMLDYKFENESGEEE
jgi:hypothetical protein